MMSAQSQTPSHDSIFARVDLFAGFGVEVWKRMENGSRQIALAKGAEVFRAGDNSDEFFVLASGKLEVSVNRSGRKVVLATLEPCSYFGEMAMLAAEPRSATVTATEDSVVMEMNRQLLMEIFRSHPGLMDQMAKNIAARKRANTPVLHAEAEAMNAGTEEHASSLGLLERLRHVFHFGK